MNTTTITMMNKLFKRLTILILLFIISTILVRAQDSIVIKGVVLSNINRPLSNVSVNIEGSMQLPIVTNDSGEFAITSASGDVWLIISTTEEYKAKRVYLNNRKDLKIYLSPKDIASGDDELSFLSRQVRRRNMVAAYSDIIPENISHTATLTADQYLQGRIPGAFVINRSGMPGSGAFIAIRGIRSIYASCQPLYIIDGIPLQASNIFSSSLGGYSFNPTTAVNSFDISKATIIKDPAITAAYGSKASNGLILIETLDPSATKTIIDVNIRGGVSLAPSNQIPQLNADQNRTFMNEVIHSSGMHEEDIKLAHPSLFLTKEDNRYINYQHNTNWQDYIFTNSSLKNVNLDVKGGDEVAKYGLSLGFINSQGIIKNTDFQGYNLRFVSRINIFRWLKMNAGVSFNYNSAKLKEAATVKETSPILTSLAKSPLQSPYQYDLNKNQTKILSEVDDIGISNPLATIENYDAKNHDNNFNTYADLEVALEKHLLVKSKFSLTNNTLKEEIFMPNHGMEDYYNTEAYNVLKIAHNDLKTFYNNTYLSYRKDVRTDQYFMSNTGLNIQSDKYQLDWVITKNTHESDQYKTINAGQADLKELGGQNKNWNWLSVYENIIYNYKDKYLFSGSVSLDFSSRIGKNAINTIKVADQPFGLFYSGGIAWRLSNEAFLKELSWLEDLKLRFSAGKSGNDDIGEVTALNYYNAIKYRTTIGLYPTVLPNDKLTYETLDQIDGGLDIALWGNRLTACFDVFQSKTSNMLLFSPMEAYLGYNVRAENSGSMKNTGWESNIFIRMIDKNSFKWDISANISRIRNKVTSIKGNRFVTSVQGAEIVNEVGAPANSFYGYKFLGVYSTQAEATAANLVNDKMVPYKAGDAIFEDISGPDGVPDHIINGYDKSDIGSPLPKYFGGLENAFTYKRWTFSALIQFVSGNKVFNYLRYKNEQMTGLENQSKNVLNRWQYDGQVTSVPRALWKDPMGNSSFSTRWIEDGSYVRVKNISLSYKIPDKILAFRNAEVYFSVNNIFTFTKYLGYDPEFAYSFSQLHQGIDYGQMPQPRQFIAGIKIGL